MTLVQQFKISYQLARAIIGKESNTLNLTALYKDLKSGLFSEFLLKTGAKMIYAPGRGWLIHGYAYDERDINPYRREKR